MTQVPARPRAKSPRPTAHSTAQFNSKDRQDVKCPLCVELGRKYALNHPVGECWVNPHNPRHRPALYEARMKQLQEKGHPIPALMQRPTAGKADSDGKQAEKAGTAVQRE